MKIYSKDNRGLLIGLIFGVIITPLLVTLGLISAVFEWLRPILIGPMDFMGNLIPDIQTGPDNYYTPWYKWILAVGFNGICYALIGWLIQKLLALKNIEDKN